MHVVGHLRITRRTEEASPAAGSGVVSRRSRKPRGEIYYLFYLLEYLTMGLDIMHLTCVLNLGTYYLSGNNDGMLL